MRKVREKGDGGCVETAFGVTRHHAASECCSRLSKSREPGEGGNLVESRDMKGLLHVDHLRAVGRLTGTNKDSQLRVIPLRNVGEETMATLESELNPKEISHLLSEMDAFCEQCEHFPPSAGSQAAFAAIIKGVINWKRASTVTA